jgi:hypothetical protein
MTTLDAEQQPPERARSLVTHTETSGGFTALHAPTSDLTQALYGWGDPAGGAAQT